MIYTNISNISVRPIKDEDAQYQAYRSHLNQAEYAEYLIGEEFEYVFGSESALFLKDKDGDIILVPTAEQECFEVK